MEWGWNWTREAIKEKTTAETGVETERRTYYLIRSDRAGGFVSALSLDIIRDTVRKASTNEGQDADGQEGGERGTKSPGEGG